MSHEFQRPVEKMQADFHDYFIVKNADVQNEKNGIGFCAAALEHFPTNLDHLMRISGSLGQAGHEARCGASCKWHNAADGLDILTGCGTQSSDKHQDWPGPFSLWHRWSTLVT
nr:hypothetical protein [uncultured Roseibium sp.]